MALSFGVCGYKEVVKSIVTILVTKSATIHKHNKQHLALSFGVCGYKEVVKSVATLAAILVTNSATILVTSITSSTCVNVSPL